MTADKLKEVVGMYAETLSDMGIVSRRAVENNNTLPLEHCLWMCSEVATFASTGGMGKANRWLGFIQGILWLHGTYTLDELRDHNR